MGRKVSSQRRTSWDTFCPGSVPEDAQCALVLGGDGTLIRAARELGGYNIPLLGINLGTLGYLAEVELKDFKEALDQLFEGTPHIEERMMLSGTVESVVEDVALNDIVLTRDGGLRVVKFNVYVNGTLLNTYLADGIIISTPTGTTWLQSLCGRSIRGTHSEHVRHHAHLFPCAQYEQHCALLRGYDRGGNLRGQVWQGRTCSTQF